MNFHELELEEIWHVFGIYVGTGSTAQDILDCLMEGESSGIDPELIMDKVKMLCRDLREFSDEKTGEILEWIEDEC